MADTTDTIVSTPVVVDLGKVRKKRIKQLKKGRGKLFANVGETVDEVVEGLGADVHGKEIVPIIIVYKQKSKKRRKGAGLWPVF